MNLIFISKVILWFLRIFGVTFGGLSIDSNGRIFVNKCYKFYGYIIIFIFVSLEIIKCYAWMRMVLTSHRPINVTLFALSYTMGILQSLQILSTLYTLNVQGFKIIKLCYHYMDIRILAKFKFKLVLIFIFWIFQIICCFVLNTTNMFTTNKKILIIINIKNIFTITSRYIISNIILIITLYSMQLLYVIQIKLQGIYLELIYDIIRLIL